MGTPLTAVDVDAAVAGLSSAAAAAAAGTDVGARAAAAGTVVGSELCIEPVVQGGGVRLEQAAAGYMPSIGSADAEIEAAAPSGAAPKPVPTD